MAVKKLMKKFHPLSLYIVLVLTIFYFLLQLVVSYFTHALTLTIDSYLMLCNLIALFGCIITIKICDTEDGRGNDVASSATTEASESSDEEKNNDKGYIPCENPVEKTKDSNAKEKHLRNTFGWARIDVLVMLIGCVTFTSLCFSTVLEALQTLIHITHEDEMHCPKLVFCIGAFGLVLNGFSYLLIGGYTFRHGSCLRITASGAVVLDNVLPSSGHRKLNLRSYSNAPQSKPGILEMCRDVTGCIFVMICSAVTYFFEERPLITKLADPILSIISALLLLILTYRYMKESCCILLQTIPNHINVDLMCRQLMKDFPDVLNVHDLHVWQFSKGEIFLTAHIIFLTPQIYGRVTKKISNFFHERGITTVTIQPEFYKDTNCLELISSIQGNCLVMCMSPDCYQRYCCDLIDPEELRSICISQTPVHELKNVPEPDSSPTRSPENNETGCCEADVVEDSEMCKSSSSSIPEAVVPSSDGTIEKEGNNENGSSEQSKASITEDNTTATSTDIQSAEDGS